MRCDVRRQLRVLPSRILEDDNTWVLLVSTAMFVGAALFLRALFRR